ncbi:hypothetical protein [Blastococcus sp. CT_GayMR16]|uniref:hypothetical protein n=1 Tax=Blastococcus sp. CT_GayMR16 TaxID=2559607 RepID=UPI001073123D|nr:hypothetical protein [Blastococcus sp. CT_GayMR16]TFV89903.1 hypothetical protein E4P38_05475 [Blastococcus sp. CT_GayMR16]
MAETPGGTDSPGDLINRFEGVLRELIRAVLGQDWHEGAGIDLEKLREKQEYERGRRRGVVISEDLLAFTEHLQLAKIIDKHWVRFAKILGDKKRWTVYSDRISAIRNAPMHGRQLLYFEQQLLAGMTGEIGNIVAQYRSSQGPDAAWYPVIESVTDSFGNDVTKDRRPPTRLSVGDTVRFTCVGRDPQDRALTWTLELKRKANRKVDEAIGSQVELTWVVDNQDVSERTEANITMTSGGNFHRNGFYDSTMFIAYAVSPPTGLS